MKFIKKNFEVILFTYIATSVILHILYNIYLSEHLINYKSYYVDEPFYTINNLIIIIFETASRLLSDFGFIETIISYTTYFNNETFELIISVPYISYLFKSLDWTIMYVLFVILLGFIILKKIFSFTVKISLIIGVIYLIYSISYQYILSTKYSDVEYISNERFDQCECIEVTVNKVVDGDTIKVNYQGKEETVRLLYIDTPEATKEVEEYGYEATNMLKGLIMRSDKIYIEFDGNDRDKYGRLLAWVWCDDVLAQEILTKNGLVEDFYDYGNYKYEDEINAAMKYAQDNKIKIHKN